MNMSRYNELIGLLRDIDHCTGIVKKKTVDQLKEVLNDDSIVQRLNVNSESNAKGNLDWDVLFCTLHSTLLKVSLW
ncbi:Protein of unknown function, partial [Gryllus bimaculatus]